MTVTTWRDHQPDGVMFGFDIEISDGVGTGIEYRSEAVFPSERAALEGGAAAEAGMFSSADYQRVFDNGRDHAREFLQEKFGDRLTDYRARLKALEDPPPWIQELVDLLTELEAHLEHDQDAEAPRSCP